MKLLNVRWGLLQDDIDHLSVALNPIRSHQEVAAILGLSASAVRQIETSALRKIIRAMNDHEQIGEPRH
jgi:DNA-directed RNA polymerase sigma subunit (sigma70/sigma32)